jgi:hypothetical protein
MESVPVWRLLFAGSHGAVNWLMLHGKGSRAYEHTLPTKKQKAREAATDGSLAFCSYSQMPSG